MTEEQLAIKKKNTRKRSIGGKEVFVTMTADEAERLELLDEAEDEYEAELKKKNDALPSSFSRVWAMVENKGITALALFGYLILAPTSIVFAVLMG
jgi:hypothetical protein